jgi:hypothetical protein
VRDEKGDELAQFNVCFLQMHLEFSGVEASYRFFPQSTDCVLEKLVKGLRVQRSGRASSHFFLKCKSKFSMADTASYFIENAKKTDSTTYSLAWWIGKRLVSVLILLYVAYSIFEYFFGSGSTFGSLLGGIEGVASWASSHLLEAGLLGGLLYVYRESIYAMAANIKGNVGKFFRGEAAKLKFAMSKSSQFSAEGSKKLSKEKQKDFKTKFREYRKTYLKAQDILSDPNSKLTTDAKSNLKETLNSIESNLGDAAKTLKEGGGGDSALGELTKGHNDLSAALETVGEVRE